MRKERGWRDGRSDEALLGAIALGDEEAGIAFVRRYQRRVYGLAYSIVGEAALAEDVAQEALLRAWSHAAVYDTRRGSVAGWLLTITRNLAVDTLRLRRSLTSDPEAMARLDLASVESPEEAAETDEAARAVRSALTLLPPEQRRALLYAAFYGLTAKEVAEREAIPLGTAKTRIRSGLMKVRQALSSAGTPVGLKKAGEE